MIQHWMKDKLRIALPTYKVTADYEPQAPTYITVFFEGGADPSNYDFKYRYPRYMVWIESDDWGLAEYLAQQVYDTLHDWDADNPPENVIIEYRNRQDELIGSQTITLRKIHASGDVNRIGVVDGKMAYSVNFDTTITMRE